jgi:PAS domain S-box-containing protein
VSRDPAPWHDLLDRLAVAGVVVDRDGTILHANPAVESVLGWAADDLVGQPVAVLVPERYLRAHQAGFDRWATTGESRLGGRLLRVPARCADGHERPIEISLSPQAEGIVIAMLRSRDAPLDAVNAIVLDLVTVLSDDQRTEDAIQALLAAIGERLAWDAVNLWVVDDERGLIRPVGTWSSRESAFGPFARVSRETTFPKGRGLPGTVWATGLPERIERLDAQAHFPRAQAAAAADLKTGFAFPIERAGVVVGVIEMFRARPEPIDGDLPDILAGIGGRLGPYLDRAIVAEHRHRAEQRLRLITRSNELLARWLDYPAPLDDLCNLLVPAVAEVCVIDLVEGTRLRRVGEAYADPEFEAAVEQLSELIPIETVNAGPIAVVRSGETLVYEGVSADELAEGLPGVPRDLIERLAPASTLIVPLVGRGHTVGTLCLSHRGGHFDDDDRRFAEELGRHVGLAVANSQLYEREHAVAAALQQSLLPPRLPEVPGMEIAARYEPGGTRLAVGGDFYDVFEAGEGVWYAVVGDVCGTGAEAAAITSQVRYTARALASRVPGPAALLGEINDRLLDRNDTRFCTAVAARLAALGPATQVTLACGGHPPPVIVDPEGAQLVECQGTLLGVYPDVGHGELTLELAPGRALVLYTDGVTECRAADGQLLSEDGLVEVLSNCKDEHAEKIATQVIETAVQHAAFGPADDIVVLVVRQA